MTRAPIHVDTTETTGHEWDGISEYNRPLPRWWLYIFWATIVWSVGYWVAMPAIPLIHGYTKGILGHSQRKVLAGQMEEVRQARSAFLDRIRAMSLEEIRADPDLLNFAIAGGRSAFAVNCSQCHGRGAAGAPGYPNLNDDAWLWGGTLDSILTTIRFGVRSGHPDARISQMPAFVRDQILTRDQVSQVAAYVLSLSGGKSDPASAAEGRPLFADNCAPCHGASGEGNREFGAPSLKDAIWLYGGDQATVEATIANSRAGVMPAWEGRLAPETLKELAIYVHSLGGGE